MIYFAQCQVTQNVKIGTTTDWDRSLAAIRSGSPTPVKLMKLVNITNPGFGPIKAMFATQRQENGWYKPTRGLLEFIDLPLIQMEQRIREWQKEHPGAVKEGKKPMPKFEFAGYTGLYNGNNVYIACCRTEEGWKGKYAQITYKGAAHISHWSTLAHRLEQLGIDLEEASFWRSGNDSIIKIEKPKPHKGPIKGNRLSR